MTDSGGFDLSGLLQQAQAMQAQLAAAQEAQAATLVTGSAGGGKVTVQVTGAGEFQQVTIAPDVVDPEDIELLEELVLAALHDASSQIAELQTGVMGDLQMPDLGAMGGGLDRLLGGS